MRFKFEDERLEIALAALEEIENSEYVEDPPNPIYVAERALREIKRLSYLERVSQ